MSINIRNGAGIALVLDPGESLTLEQAAGWLGDDNLPGAKSYQFSFPIEPNEAFLGSGYRPDAARPVMEFVVTAQFQNVFYRRCLFNYRIGDNGKGLAYLKIDGGEVFSKLRKLSLKEALATSVVLGTSVAKQLPTRMLEIAGMTPGTFPLTFFPLRNEGFFEESLDDSKVAGFARQPYVNAWTTQGFKIDTSTVRGYPVVPFFYLAWVLKQLFARAGYRLEGDWLSDMATQRLVILNQTAISAHTVTVLKPLSHRVTPGQHLPEMNVGDFLKAVRQRFGLMFTFNSTTQVATIRRFTDVVKSKPVDLTPYLVGKFGIEPPSNQGFSLVDYIDNNDELYRDAKNQTIIPDGLPVGGTVDSDRQEVKLAVGSCQMIVVKGVTLNTAKWIVPTIRQAGNILDDTYKTSESYPDEWGKLKNEVNLRIISYYGLQPDSVGINYPLASSDNRNTRQEVIADWSSNLAGRDGVWRRTLRNFYHFRDQTRQVIANLNLPTGVAAGLVLHQPITLQLKGHARRTYLIEKLQSESPGPSGLMASKLYALSIPDGLELKDLTPPPRVWVELLQSEAYSEGPATNGDFKQKLATITVRCWKDQAKTQPATVENLLLNVRIKQTFHPVTDYQPTPDYIERIIPFTIATGPTQILLGPLYTQLIRRQNRTPTPLILDDYVATYSLDPGDDYFVLG